MTDNILELRMQLSSKLIEMRDLCGDMGLPELTRFTLIARDPDNDSMSLMLTNEPGDDAIRRAFDVALKDTSKT